MTGASGPAVQAWDLIDPPVHLQTPPSTLVEAIRRVPGTAELASAARIDRTEWGEIFAEYQLLFLALEGGARESLESGSTHRSVVAETLAELALSAVRLADEIALLLAAYGRRRLRVDGAWAHWRTLFQHSLTSKFIYMGAKRDPKSGPLTVEEEEFAASADQYRSEMLAERFRAAQDVGDGPRASNEDKWLRANGLQGIPRQEKDAAWQRTKAATELLTGTPEGWPPDWAWAFPGAPSGRKAPRLGMKLVLDALEYSDPTTVTRARDGKQLAQHVPDRFLWDAASAAVHVGSAAGEHVPLSGWELMQATVAGLFDVVNAAPMNSGRAMVVNFALIGLHDKLRNATLRLLSEAAAHQADTAD